MFESLYNAIPLALAMIISQIIYFNLDKKYNVTNKIDNYIKINQKWKPFLCTCIMFLCMFIIGLLGIYIIYIPTILYFLLCGIIAGTGISITVKLTNKNNENSADNKE